MSNLVTVRPKPGSRRFKATKGMFNFHTVSEDGGKTTVDKNIGEYKSERFPKSRQMFRISTWSLTKRQWLLDGFTEMNIEKQAELDKLVTACKFKYGENHPQNRQYIVTADVNDFNDPFFTHKSAKIIANQGEFVLDKSKPLDNLLLRGLKKNPQFQSGSEENPIYSNRVKYIIVDRQIDSKKRKEKRNKEKESLDLYYSLTDDKKATVAMALRLIPNESVSRDMIDEALYAYCKDTTVATDTKQSKQDYFIEVCSISTEKLAIKHMIQKAKSMGFLKKNKQTYILFGNNVGRNLKEVEAFLSHEDNQDIVMRLEESFNA